MSLFITVPVWASVYKLSIQLFGLLHRQLTVGLLFWYNVQGMGRTRRWVLCL